MPFSTSNVFEGLVGPHSASGTSQAKPVKHWLTSLVARFGIFPRLYPSMIAELRELEEDKQIAIVLVPRTRQSIRFKYDSTLKQVLLANVSKLVEIDGKIRMDECDNPIAVSTVKHIELVNTNDIVVAEILPDFLHLNDTSLHLIKVELDETQRFYCAELEDLNLFACGLSRGHLKEQLRENLEVCWDEFVREDGSDLSQDARDLRDKLLSSFKEVKR